MELSLSVAMVATFADFEAQKMRQRELKEKR